MVGEATQLELKRGDQLPLSLLTEAWNLGYTGYFIPVYFTDSELTQWMEAGSFDLSRCLVLMDGEAPVGFSFLGVRGGRGWLGGFGISPGYRGRGLAYHLFQEHVDLCRETGMEALQLEVLVENWAHKVYARAGFAVTRRLTILQGSLPRRSLRPVARVGSPMRILAHSDRLHGANPPVWQRELASLAVSMPDYTNALYTGPEDRPTGYLLYQAVADRVRILDAAGGEGEAAALIGGLAARYPEIPVSVVNEPEGSPFYRTLTALGCTEVRAQWEMRWSRS